MQINRILASLELEEKIALVSGADQWRTTAISRLNIPAIMVADGPHGLRKQAEGGDHLGLAHSEQATCFPPAATIANSWDTDLVYSSAQAIGKEAISQDVAVVLGPGANIKRSPLCGRNFEYFSEDPFLTGELAKAWINGIQEVGVGASLKHFAANNQERWRLINDSVVDKRALREIYLAGFERAISQARPWTVMAAYNKLNGTYCCEHPELLTTILRDEWGFEGAVISDWGAVNDPVLSIKAGLDLEMPSTLGESAVQIREDLATGRLTEAALNKAVRNVLNLILKAQKQGNKKDGFDQEEHHNLAQKIASQSTVLLKNEHGILPLKAEQKILLVGEFAKTPRYQGTGSSLVNPTKVATVLEEITNQSEHYQFVQGYNLNDEEINEALIAKACTAAEGVDVVVIFAGLPAAYESEGYDRTHLNLPPAHNELIARLSVVNPNIVVVLAGGAPVLMPWLEHVKGLLHTYLGGQAGAGAIIDLLFGKENPSGKLSESYPLQLEDHPGSRFFAHNRDQTEYRESIFVGYRYFDAAQKEVLFPFGFGLSYTRFKYSQLELIKQPSFPHEPIRVKCTIENIGERYGGEVVQLYLGKPKSAIFRAPRELKGFRKIWLKPGERQVVEFSLDERAFAYYNVAIEDWHIESGEYIVSIGSSSRDLHLQATIAIESPGVEVEVPSYLAEAPEYYQLAKEDSFSKGAFLAVYGSQLPPLEDKDRFHANSTLEDLQVTKIGRLVARVLENQLGKMIGVEDKTDPTWQMAWISALEMPMRSVASFTDGKIPQHLVDALIAAANKEYGEAFGYLFRR